MTKERYVSFEVAKLLQEKGFEGETHKVFDEDGDLYDNSTLKSIPAPTQQVACDWLLEKHKIYALIQPIIGKGYKCILCNIKDFSNVDYIGCTGFSSHVESIINIALEFALKNLI